MANTSNSIDVSLLRCLAFIAVLVTSSFLIVTITAQDVSAVEIEEGLESLSADEDGPVEAVIRFNYSTPPQSVEVMKKEVADNRKLVDDAAKNTSIEVKSKFWLANAVLVEANSSDVLSNALSSIDGVDNAHSNFEVEHHRTTISDRTYGTPVSTASISTQSSYTYGIDQINAPDAWQEFGTQGEGARVAVLDTGVDPNHPDINLYTDDSDDPTYPGGWAEINPSGEKIEGSQPYDSHEHGTHVSGIVSGGDESGTHIGVAPDAELMHALVIDGDTGEFAQVVGGMEWAVENDADVMTMSFGFDGYLDSFIDPIRNARSQGVITVASTGNSGDGTSGSPSNVFDSVSVGSTDAGENVPSFSSGETINKHNSWEEPPSDWPDEYVVPDVVAPGVSVQSAVPGGDYDTKSGTSMSAPHVSGSVALMISAAGDEIAPNRLRSALETSASKPDGWRYSDGERDSRYGYGVIDASEAVGFVASDNDPAFFDVSIDGTDSPITSGNPLSVDITVKNKGDISDTQTLTAELSDIGSQSKTVSMEGISSSTGSFSIPTEGAEGGEYTLQVSSEDDSDSAKVIVEEPAYFDVSIDSTNSPVTAGNLLTVDATVTNTGNREGTQSVIAEVTDVGTSSDTLNLNGGESKTATLGIQTESDDVGTHTLSVSTEDAADSTTVTVESAVEVAYYQLSNLTPDTVTMVEGGTDIDISVTIQNTGNATGSQDITLTVEGGGATVYEDREKNLVMDVAAEENVTFTDIPASSFDAGKYTYTVSSDDDSLQGDLSIEVPDEGLVSEDNPFGDSENEPVSNIDAIRVLHNWRSEPTEQIDGREISRIQMIEYLDEWRSAKA